MNSISNSYSIRNRNRAIINELASRGHNVTMLSPFSDAKAPLNVHYIKLECKFEGVHSYMKGAVTANETSNSIYGAILLQDLSSTICSGEPLLLLRMEIESHL